VPECGQPDPFAELLRLNEADWQALFADVEAESEKLQEMARRSEADLRRLGETRSCGTCGQEIE